jgi:hypothetical protein
MARLFHNLRVLGQHLEPLKLTVDERWCKPSSVRTSGTLSAAAVPNQIQTGRVARRLLSSTNLPVSLTLSSETISGAALAVAVQLGFARTSRSQEGWGRSAFQHEKAVRLHDAERLFIPQTRPDP